MSETEDRKLAADIVRAIGGGIAGGVGVAVPGVGLAIAGAVNLAARLIELLGVSHAAVVLEELVQNPARLITQPDLDEQTAAVITELERTAGEHPEDDPAKDLE